MQLVTRIYMVPSPIISLVSSLLRNEEDDIIQLYALRSIENIFCLGGYWSACITSQDVITNLCYIFKAPEKQEIMRLTAGSCLARLVRFNPYSIQRVMEKLSFKDMVSSLVRCNPQEQQICLNILNMTLLESHTLPSVGRRVDTTNLDEKISKFVLAHGVLMLVDHHIVSPVLFHPLELEAERLKLPVSSWKDKEGG
ncbi:hypothetical protein KY285_012544 [Solanum tuberosum]|nr:hypothetical protein KY289_011143 [Solanum tuberosum]KAH0736837.1 hypothetical protein KY285_012544 [Solanum tuberosum]